MKKLGKTAKGGKFGPIKSPFKGTAMMKGAK